MEENKDLMNAEETVEEVTEVTADSLPAEKKESLLNKIKALNSNKIRNEALFKRGGIAVAITAIVLAVVILFNFLVSVVSKRFHLEFDLSSQKVSTISEENIKFIKDIDSEVTITVCASEENYLRYIQYYSENYYSTSPSTVYFEQTKTLIDKYAEYNSNITLRYMDPQSPEFTELTSEYTTLDFIPGDILVSSNASGANRHKKISFGDIYEITDESGYASYGGSYTITGNKIETALTSAIAYATSDEVKSVALITGHGNEQNTTAYRTLLADNNFEVDIISNAVLTSISKEYDIIAILSPSVDFASEEIDAISEFLDNDGKLGKGLLFFADAINPALPNLYEFLVEWGIEIEDGILFETDESNYTPGDPTVFISYAMETEVTNEMGVCATGYNVPMVATTPAEDTITVTPYFMTTETVVKAPAGVSADWKGYAETDKAQYAGVIQSKKIGADKDNNEVQSYVMAFGSVEYVQSEWASNSRCSNLDIVLACTNIAAGVEDVEITFLSKTVTDESFVDSITQGGVNLVKTIFMIIIPLLTLATGIYIYIRRRNA